jgi:hypothetical protein
VLFRSVVALGTASVLNVPATGNAASNQVVNGSDTRLTNTRDPNVHNHTISEISNAPAPYIAVSKWTGTGGTGTYEARPTVQSSGFVVFDSSADVLAPPPSTSSISGGGAPSARDEWKTLRTD